MDLSSQFLFIFTYENILSLFKTCSKFPLFVNIDTLLIDGFLWFLCLNIPYHFGGFPPAAQSCSLYNCQCSPTITIIFIFVFKCKHKTS